jgi:hypothetical protein
VSRRPPVSFLLGLRRESRPLFVSALCAALAFGPSTARPQDPLRPWADWRTIQTRNYRLHFPRELEAWTRAAAERVESIDSALVSLVGQVPPRPIDVVVDDPFNVSNGYVLPFIDRPVTVWWATPANPRTDIGNYRSWGEMLSVHELAHVVHLTRPSRNPFQRQLWSSLPVNLGPISREVPRWVYEGYATLLEGRVTGTGRPNNVWRPALLRQWAIEGRLPTYSQLNWWDDFAGGDFAYLGGSAFLEWLTRRAGGSDSSLVAMWRRLTARRVRSFNASFVGVYGDSPQLLYGRHTAELTRDAMLAMAELDRAGLVEGEMIQRLAWETGDPALSPNGSQIAIVLRQRDRPSRVVVWNTAPEPEDTAALRRRVEELKKDPFDVPDRRFYPREKKALKTLHALNGRSYQQPRWLPDNRRVLLTRWAPRADGSSRPDLYLWDTETSDVRRVTRGAGVMTADPHPSDAEAIATRCLWGRCDVVAVDLRGGRTRTLLQGDPRRSYYRPRYSRDGTRFVASVSDGGRWRLVVADRDGTNPRYVDPEDGANRYDAQWLRGGDTLVVVSERGGIPNLELVSVAGRGTRTLTRVTGAAVAPEVSATDGAIWFLALHSRGFDVRRLARAATVADSVVVIGADRFGFAGARGTHRGMELAARPIPAARPYGNGPRHQRWLPGGSASADGGGVFVAIFSGDIVGRLNATATAAYGEASTWRGGSVRATWRHPRPAIEFGTHAAFHEPSLGRFAQAGTDTLDIGLLQGIVAASLERRGEGWYWRGRAGTGGGSLESKIGTPSHFRGLAFGELDLQLSQTRGAGGLIERFRVHAAQGHTRGAYQRAIGSLELATTGRGVMPMQAVITFGRITGNAHPFERFAIGGVPPAIVDSSLLGQRYSMPMFPTGIAVGSDLVAWRAAVPSSTWTLFYEGASIASGPVLSRRWHRALGLDMRYVLPPVPAAFAPRVQMRGGGAYTLDAPFRKKVRLFFEMRVEP